MNQGQKCERTPAFLKFWKNSIALYRSSFSPYSPCSTSSAVLFCNGSPHAQDSITSQWKCNSKKNSSIKSVNSESCNIVNAIGISISGVSISNLKETKSEGVAISLIIRNGESKSDSFSLTGALKKWYFGMILGGTPLQKSCGSRRVYSKPKSSSNAIFLYMVKRQRW